jgi:peptidyl-prolyl cis-trans isomerase A (cyclophilin A)
MLPRQGRQAQGLGGKPDDLLSVKLKRNQDTMLTHQDESLSMARNGPDKATPDLSICIGPQPELDFGGKRYPDGQGIAAFGRVIKGMDVVKNFQAAPAERRGCLLRGW